MARRSASTVKTKLDAGTRILVLHGPEQMLKREAFERLQEALRDQYGELDPVTFDGKTAALADVMDELRTLSLLQSYRLVVVEDADQFVTAHRQALERYAKSPAEQATLVLRSDRWTRGNLDKFIQQVGAMIKCGSPKASDAASWLIRRADEVHQRQLTQAAASMLVDRLGTGLMRLDSELAKLALMVDEKRAIGPLDLTELIGRSSDEQAWVVQMALLDAFQVAGNDAKKDAESGGGRAIRKVRDLVDLSGQPAVLVGYFVADLFRKLHVALMMRQQGAPDGQIAKHLRLWGPQQVAFTGFMRRLNSASAGRLFDRIVEFDRRSKSGFGTPLRNLECFCTAVADELN